MEKFQTILKIATKQSNFGFGLVALITAGGEQIFSSVAFKCPCNELSFIYGLVFLVVPALALLLFGFILSKKTWKLTTGLCHRKTKLCKWRNLKSMGLSVFQISACALVAPTSWTAVALLHGSYYECAMTGANFSSYRQDLCRGVNSEVKCQTELQKFPCEKAGNGREEVLRNLRAQSQILGWLLIASIMISNLLLICVARCTSPISYLQLKFWREYAEEENDLMNAYTNKHAKELAERNLKSFFNQTTPANVVTPCNQDWEKISSLYKFSTKDHYYSTLHKYVENKHEAESCIRMVSIRSNESADNPPVLDFVDGGTVSL
ncbi:Protein FAM26F [Oryzias melastigma]|uniref:Calcium homeostasis modulator family member 6 n=1 Tax=Oryzias melastigma TaxID=30732 RepID=A0A3B3CQU7_ORYME|nr:calcium homeostasis modulator protein 6 [Oryzias melastigma]XP_036067101.1 calcium homeostasis modulator protein 6 [Oryzias melastigma]XP_036067102.1 calcium homeostasis modulator protein 6 [Oryzias melastigma]KAF6719134.1 Protein FAM26F [Oryzias melastigma]